MSSQKLAMEEDALPKSSSNRKRIVVVIIAVILVFIIAFVIGYFSRSTKNVCEHKQTSNQNPDGKLSGEQKDFFKTIVESISTDELKANLRFFAGKPHAASTPRNNDLIREIYNRFQSYGFKAEYFKYDVLLSFPDLKKRNYVYIHDRAGKELFKSKGIEDFLEPSENDTTSLPPFNAYSPNGTVEGELIYVNYGRYEDFEELLTKYNMNVSGKIVLARYGKIFRGDKVANAEDRGAIGVLLYSDPSDYTPVPANQTYPNGRWLPSDGVQRGSILKSSQNDLPSGDPLTGDYPAKDWVYRRDPSDLKDLPKIPTQPIAADDALELMKKMGGQLVHKEWKGGMVTSYKIGPFADSNLYVKVVVNNKLEIKTITNVCGTIKGHVEPDRYVLLGNHIDAWVSGGVDPSSGTTIMMETARVIALKMKQTGWQPRRTIKFCGWDGEEHGLIGSCEYVEEFRSQLRDRAIAYINVDSGVSGNESLYTAASPVLHNLMFEISQLVNDPINDMTVFDNSKNAYPDKNYPDLYKIDGLGSGSDYFAFYQFIGVPSVDMGYSQSILNKKLGTSGYPMYHSLHDTVQWIEKFVDKEYKVHRTVAQVATFYLLYLSESPLLPFNIKRYGELLVRSTKKLSDTLKKHGAGKAGVTAEYLMSAANNFSTSVKSFEKELSEADLNNPLQLRMLNDRMIQVEKGFIHPPGLPNRPSIKHYVMAPSLHNTYGSSSFPGIADLMYDIDQTKNWDAVAKQLSITTYLIQAVADSLAFSS